MVGPELTVCVTPFPKSQYHEFTAMAADEVSFNVNALPTQSAGGVMRKSPGGLS